jgi:hypothetical protein
MQTSYTEPPSRSAFRQVDLLSDTTPTFTAVIVNARQCDSMLNGVAYDGKTAGSRSLRS